MTRTRARLAVAAACSVCSAAGFGAWFKVRLRPRWPRPSCEAVQPAPFDALVIPADANLKGAWSAVGTWPVIAVHMVLMPDGRVLSYGTDGDRQADRLFHLRRLGFGGRSRRRPPDAAQRDGHRHLLQLAAHPAARRIRVRRRRRQLDRHRHHQHRQQQQQPVQLRREHAGPRQQHEPGALVFLVDGVDQRRGLHPGRHRRHRPARGPRHQRHLPAALRSGHQRSRLHVPAQLRGTGRPRLRLRQRGPDVLRQYQRHRLDHPGGPVRVLVYQRQLQHGDVRARPHPAVRRQLQRRDRHRHQRRLPDRHARRNRCPRSGGGSPRPCSPTARCLPPAAVRSTTSSPGSTTSRRSGTRPPGPGRGVTRARWRACTTPPLCCCRMRPCWSPAAAHRGP